MPTKLPFDLPSLHEEAADKNPFVVLKPYFDPFEEEVTPNNGFITFDDVLKRSQVDKNTPLTMISHLMTYPSTLHRHDFIEMTFVVNGRALMVSEHQPFLLTEDSLIITPAGVSHFISPLPNRNEKPLVVNLILKAELLEQLHLPYFEKSLLDTIGGSTLPIFIDKNDFYRCSRSLYQVIEDYYENGFSFSYPLLANLIQFFVDLAYITEEDDSPLDELTQKVQQLIQGHYQDISLESLALELSYSQGYLSRHIKKQTGQTISQLIAQEKLRHAEKALSSSDQAIADIAEEVGYQSLGHFYRIFKETYHVTPRQYRKMVEKSKNA